MSEADEPDPTPCTGNHGEHGGCHHISRLRIALKGEVLVDHACPKCPSFTEQSRPEKPV